MKTTHICCSLLVTFAIVSILVIWFKASNEDVLDTSKRLSDVEILERKAADSSAEKDPNPVHVSVYYETLCPDSIAFVKSQLWPAYQDLRSIMRVQLIPYGKASQTKEQDGSWSFQCQHGAPECYGNKAHACALRYTSSERRGLKFVQCSLSGHNPADDNILSSCARQNSLPWSNISQCAKTSEGGSLLARNGDMTNGLIPKMVFVPWILIDGVYSEENEGLALTNFKQLICKSYKGPKHPKC